MRKRASGNTSVKHVPFAALTLQRGPNVVPEARHFARSVLLHEAPELLSNAELVVSELVTNAFLHGEPPITLRLGVLPAQLRLEVEDAGVAMPVPLLREGESMTGRGLSLVNTLCSAWGIDRRPSGGKLVWAELERGRQNQTAAAKAEMDVAALLGSWDDVELATSWYTVSLGPVPTELLLSAKAQMDNVVRELTLIEEGELSRGSSVPAELAVLVQTVTQEFAEVRAAVKVQAAAAAARGQPVTNLELNVPVSVAEAGERYLAALDLADRYARSGHLLTLAPPAVHGIFRRWYVRTLVDQVRALSKGDTPPALRPFGLVLADEVARLGHLQDTAARLALLQGVTSALAQAKTPEEMGEAVVTSLVRSAGVRGARVRVITEEGMLRSVAWRGEGDDGGDALAELPLSSDLPGAEAVRTRRTILYPSMAAILNRFPQLTSFYPDDRSVQLVPLAVGGTVLGLLSVTFEGGELSDEARTSLMGSVAGVLSQALQRAQLASRDEEVRETLSFLADVTSILVSAREPRDVVERLVRQAVPRLGDWCTVYLAESGGLRRVAMAIDGFPEVGERLKARTLSLDLDIPQVRAYKSGRAELIPEGAGTLLESLYPGLDFAALGGDRERASGACVPIVLRGERIGVIALTFLGSGRRISPGILESIRGLAERSALALDNARHWSHQHQALQALVAALLPAEPPSLPGIEFAARYLPAAADVAGDWWEAELLPDGTVLLGLGDAAGHGVGAVSQMCELRHGARALAAVDPSPAALLADLNRRLSGPDAGFATAFYGRLNPLSGELRWASAGHVPPLYVGAGGIVTPLVYPEGVPLGAPRATARVDNRLVLAPGEVLVLYSDGVVERRDEALDDGIDRLVRTVVRHSHAELNELAELIIAEHCAQPLDDACLLLVRRRP